VAVELKQGKFQAEFSGKMKLYLKWLNRYERQEGEKEPIGLILCAGGNNREQIELLEMDKIQSNPVPVVERVPSCFLHYL